MPFDQHRADAAVRNVERFYKGLNYVLPRWQRDDVIRPLYGTMTTDGRRQYRWGYVSVGRKNGKTQLTAALGLQGLFASTETLPEVQIVAPSLEATRPNFAAMEQMIYECPPLKRQLDRGLIKINTGANANLIRWFTDDGRPRGFIHALTSGGRSKHGKHPSLVLFDEFHVLDDSELYTAMTTGSGTRAEPMFLITTTAGADAEGLCHDHYRKAKHILNGTLSEPSYFAYIREVPQDADHMDESNWVLANPGIEEDSPFRVFLLNDLRAHAQAAQNDPREMANFRRLKMNQWIGHHEAYLDMQKFNAVERDLIKDEDLKGLPCVAGCDLAARDDFCCIALLFQIDQVFVPRVWLFTAGGTVKAREKRDGIPYASWIEQGLVIASGDSAVSYKDVADHLLTLREVYDIDLVALDPSQADFLAEYLSDSDMTVYEFPQRIQQFTHATKELRTLVNDGRLVHNHNPALTWQAGNLSVFENINGDVRPTKKGKNRRYKIDAMVALIMALDLTLRQSGGSSEPESIYEDLSVFY